MDISDYSSSQASDEDSEASSTPDTVDTAPAPKKRARWENRALPQAAAAAAAPMMRPFVIKTEDAEPSSSTYRQISSDIGLADSGASAVVGPVPGPSGVQREKELSLSLRKYKNRAHVAEEKLQRLLRDLHEMVECPVCFNVPRVPPVACCRNGHLICDRCRPKMQLCPSCRVPLNNHTVSLVAASILEKIDHPCDFRDEGCTIKMNAKDLDAHEKSCLYRLVRCPHWACNERITAMNLTHHVIASECGDNYRMKLMPYKEEMEYTRALDDEEGNGFWRPSLLEFENITFYLQVEKLGNTKNWYFYVQMEGSSEDCEKYGVTIKVSKSLDHNRHSTVYNGAVCPIDIKGAVEVEAHGCGLNIRDAQMEKIFVKQTAAAVRDQDDEGEEERFKFWIEVDIYSMEEDLE